MLITPPLALAVGYALPGLFFRLFPWQQPVPLPSLMHSGGVCSSLGGKSLQLGGARFFDLFRLSPFSQHPSRSFHDPPLSHPSPRCKVMFLVRGSFSSHSAVSCRAWRLISAIQRLPVKFFFSPLFLSLGDNKSAGRKPVRDV